MKKYFVEYGSDISMNGQNECDYMFVKIPDPDDEDEFIQLYTEADPLDYGATIDENGEMVWTETETYEPLKKMILEQAEEKDIDPDCLEFFYDHLNE